MRTLTQDELQIMINSLERKQRGQSPVQVNPEDQFAEDIDDEIEEEIENKASKISQLIKQQKAISANNQTNSFQQTTNTSSIKSQTEKLTERVTVSNLLSKGLNEWRPILARYCQVYVYGSAYLAKPFDQINYKFCNKDQAKEILEDNLYALLRYSFFKSSSEQIDKRIDEIVKSFTKNLKSTLLKVTFDNSDPDAIKINHLPNGSIAFQNGVYDFIQNKWLFQYNIIKVEETKNKIYQYDFEYCVLWYYNFNFDPSYFNVDIYDTSLKDFYDELSYRVDQSLKYDFDENRYMTFKLMCNIAHDQKDLFSFKKFNHLCEIIGYLLSQNFLQYFVMLVGSGGNGKNSLFDGCFTKRITPTPTSNDLNAIENDRFITGSLQNKYHNIFLETSTEEKTYSDSKMIKALTGTTMQTIEAKGIQKYEGYLNVKHIFAANDQDKLKFKDTSPGFKRRINIFEIFYAWDADGRYLKRGDKSYYKTNYSSSLEEFGTMENMLIFIYLGLFGIKSATNNFSKEFSFSKNDWTSSYSDIDEQLKITIESTNISDILRLKDIDKAAFEFLLLEDNDNRNPIYKCQELKDMGYSTAKDFGEMLLDDELAITFFNNNIVWMSLYGLKRMLLNNFIGSPQEFVSKLKKIYPDAQMEKINQKYYIRCSLANNRLRIINKS